MALRRRDAVDAAVARGANSDAHASGRRPARGREGPRYKAKKSASHPYAGEGRCARPGPPCRRPWPNPWTRTGPGGYDPATATATGRGGGPGPRRGPPPEARLGRLKDGSS